MKILVSKLKPNPFRHMDKYPIDRAKVEALKTSIREKSFWDNLLVRKVNGDYQLAYGHHRWVALKELSIKEIDVPVRVIDDPTMLTIMAEENLNWSTAPAVLIQTVQTAKEYLDKKLEKYKTIKELPPNLINLLDSKTNEQALSALKTKGVGQTTILKFLGSNWKQWHIQAALAVLNDDTIDRKAIEDIPTIDQANVFRTAVRKHNIPKPTQRRIAKAIAKDEVASKRITDLVEEHALPTTTRKPKPKPLPMLDDVVKVLNKDIAAVTLRLKQLKNCTKNIQSTSLRRTLQTESKELMDALKSIIKELGNG